MKTLISRANFVEVNCGNCLRELRVSQEVYDQVESARNGGDKSPLGKEHRGFFVSPEEGLIGSLGYYCDRRCHNISTED